jgi:hypothetical protein
MDSQEDLDKLADVYTQLNAAVALRERCMEELVSKREKPEDNNRAEPLSGKEPVDKQEDVDRVVAATTQVIEATTLAQRIIEDILRKREEAGDTDRTGPWTTPSRMLRF